MDQYFAELLPSSPTNSSISSSDLDTESTGSFFPDRSTTLGTLMGVSFPDLRARAARAQPCSDPGRGGARRAKQWRRRLRCRRWWWRCRRADARGPTSLGEFLRVERTLSGGGGAAAAAAGGAPPPPRRRAPPWAVARRSSRASGSFRRGEGGGGRRRRSRGYAVDSGGRVCN